MRKKRNQTVSKVPQPVPTMFRHSVIMRYQKTSASDANITWASLAKLYVFSKSTTQGYCIWDAVRLKRVTVYTPAVLQTGASGILLPSLNLITGSAPMDNAVSSSNFAVERVLTDMPTSQRGACVTWKMPRGSSYDQWLNAQNLQAGGLSPKCFSLQAVSGAIVDIKLSVQWYFVSSGAPNVLTSASAVSAFNVYLNNLDNTASAGGAGTNLLTCVSTSTSSNTGVGFS